MGGEMDRAMQLWTNDDRLQSVYQKKVEHIVSMCANPKAASETYKYLLSHADTHDVCIEAFSGFLPEPARMDPDLSTDRQYLQKLVDNGAVTQDDMEYYIAEATGRSAKEGNFLQCFCGPVEIHFRKK